MKAPQRVVWSEGMLVSPQHFQQQDLYHEALLDEHDPPEKGMSDHARRSKRVLAPRHVCGLEVKLAPSSSLEAQELDR